VLVPTWRTTKKQIVLACTSFSLLCSGFASISVTTSGKGEVDMSIPVYAVATPLNACLASRASRDERVAPCCPTSTTPLNTFRDDFSLSKIHGLGSVSCRDVTSKEESKLLFHMGADRIW